LQHGNADVLACGDLDIIAALDDDDAVAAL